MVAGSLNIKEFAVHRPTDLDWSALPESCIVQMHWMPGPDVFNICRSWGFRPILIVRHPLDVLISILHFCVYERETAQWLDGRCGNEEDIKGKSPTDPQVKIYATGSRCAALLDVSSAWLTRGVASIRYEDLTAQPEKELGSFLQHLGVEPAANLSDIVASNTLQRARLTTNNCHFWQGRPGLGAWLIPKRVAISIRNVHREVFDALGYDIDEACELDEEILRRRWDAIASFRSSPVDVEVGAEK